MKLVQGLLRMAVRLLFSMPDGLLRRIFGKPPAEAATLTSILRTVALNFPSTRRCVILVEGAQVETLAGHLDMVRGFDPRRWL